MLLAVGFPSVTANVNNNIAMWPGYASSAMGFRTELEGQRGRLVELGATTAAGGGLGAVLLLPLPDAVSSAAVTCAVLSARAILARQPRLPACPRGPPAPPTIP